MRRIDAQCFRTHGDGVKTRNDLIVFQTRVHLKSRQRHVAHVIEHFKRCLQHPVRFRHRCDTEGSILFKGVCRSHNQHSLHRPFHDHFAVAVFVRQNNHFIGKIPSVLPGILVLFSRLITGINGIYRVDRRFGLTGSQTHQYCQKQRRKAYPFSPWYMIHGISPFPGNGIRLCIFYHAPSRLPITEGFLAEKSTHSRRRKRMLFLLFTH